MTAGYIKELAPLDRQKAALSTQRQRRVRQSTAWAALFLIISHKLKKSWANVASVVVFKGFGPEDIIIVIARSEVQESPSLIGRDVSGSQTPKSVNIKHSAMDLGSHLSSRVPRVLTSRRHDCTVDCRGFIPDR